MYFPAALCLLDSRPSLQAGRIVTIEVITSKGTNSLPGSRLSMDLPGMVPDARLRSVTRIAWLASCVCLAVESKLNCVCVPEGFCDFVAGSVTAKELMAVQIEHDLTEVDHVTIS